MSKYKYLVPFVYCILIIFTFIAQSYNHHLLADWSIVPRNPAHLKGIITMVFIHADLEHLSSNFLPFAVCAFGVFYFYPSISLKVCLIAHGLTGVLVWFFARPSMHVGASGLIYALVFFTLISAILKRNRKLVVFAFIVLTFQSGLIYGLIPQETGISWEGHLFGAITGIFLSFTFRKYLPEPDIVHYSFENEVQDNNDEYTNLKL